MYAEPFANPNADYAVDLPVNWSVLSAENPAEVSFASEDGQAAFQVYVYEKKKFKRAEDIYTNMKSWLKAEGEGGLFFYHEYESYFADLTFTTGKYKVRGYFIFFNDGAFDYAIMAYAQLDSYAAYHDELISALDSFSLGEEGRLLPGPVSYFLIQGDNDETITYKMDIGGVEYEYPASKLHLEISQETIDREARLLASYKSLNVPAWQRFYRMIYRDNYLRLEIISKFMNDRLRVYEKKSDKIERVIKWVQGFEFSRTGTESDFLSPLGAAVVKSGDCDTRVLLALTLLRYLEVDAILLVSYQFAHSAIGISSAEYPIKGATLDWAGKKYLYTELTSQVAIGQINADFADPSGWMVFPVE